MSSVNSNPAEIRRFQAGLRQFNSEISTSTSRIRAQLNSLGSVWRDGEYVKFSQEFQTVLQTFERYMQSSDDYIRYLDNKARPLEQFLGRS